MVIFSLAIQIILTILSSCRKFTSGKWIKIIVWLAYLVADWVAIVALGKLSELGNYSEEYYRHNNIATRALWAPLLLLHLGGPDSITAYSLVDNRLWLRYLLGLAIQGGISIYVIYTYWARSWPFIMLTIPLLLAGFIKYGERTWALKYTMCNEGFLSVNEFLGCSNFVELKRIIKSSDETARDLELLTVAYWLFDDLKCHIVNLIHKRWRKWSYSFSFSLTSSSNYKFDEAFKIIDFELSFINDILYTKASFFYTSAGYGLRFISFLLIISASFGYFFAEKKSETFADSVITHALLIGAVFLEVYAATLLMFSDWALLWLTKNHKNRLAAQVLRFVAPRALSKRRWRYKNMGQFNLLTHCLNDHKPSKFTTFLNYFGINMELKKKVGRIIKFFEVDEELVKTKDVDVPEDLRKFILHIILEAESRVREETSFPDGGKWVVKGHQFQRNLDWIFDPAVTDFKERIVLWHIATDICYYSTESSQITIHDDTPHLSKMMSDYMMYLLVICPNMFSFTSDETNSWKNACNEVKRKLKEGRLVPTCEDELCSILKRKPAESFTMLSDVYELADVLMEEDDKWKVIRRVWVEMLCHVAINCQVNFHAEQLSQGRELITYIWLLLLPLAEDWRL